MYIKREIEATIDAMLKQGKVVLVAGARQVGKTTALKHHLGGGFDYVSMDDPRERALALEDAALFFESRASPHYRRSAAPPELFPAVKRVVDRPDEKGWIVLTGSQTYHLMKGVSESLAGRIRIIEMPPLSLRELVPSCGGRNPYIPSPVKPTEPAFTDIWGIVHRGSMPELQNEAIEWDSFCTDYASSYLIARNVQAVPVWAI